MREDFEFSPPVLAIFGSSSLRECKSESSLKVGVQSAEAQPQGGWSLEAALTGRKHINRSLRISISLIMRLSFDLLQFGYKLSHFGE